VSPVDAAPRVSIAAPHSRLLTSSTSTLRLAARHRLLHGPALAARPGEGRLAVEERQRLVVHDHLLGQVFGRGARLREHHRHRLADVPHAVARELPARRLLHPGQHPAAAHRLDSHEIASRENQCIRERNSLDTGVRVGRAHENAVQLAREGQIGDELAGAGEEALVLDAPQRGADHRISSRSSSSRS
jgi:hypothetical protein